MRVAILHNQDFDTAGDPSHAAREDVLNVALAVREALASRGHLATLVPLGRNALSELDALREDPPDVAVNLCESVGGDARGEALVPLALELAGIPYTGSSALAISLALHKPRCKELLRARGIPTPDWRELLDFDDADPGSPSPLDGEGAGGWGFDRAIVKPSREDASAGIHARSVVSDRASLSGAVREVVARFRQPALVERYVEGRELNVALFGRELMALPLAEIDFSKLPAHLPPIVTYAGKWDAASVECAATPSVPSELDGVTREKVIAVAREAFVAVGGRDYGRVDLRLDASGTPYVIDVNPNCDLSPEAGFAKAWARAGRSYAALCEELLEIAWSRHASAPAARVRPPTPFGLALPDPAVHAR